MPFRTPPLSSISVFQGLEEDVLTRLDGMLEAVTVPSGTILVHQGDTADALYVVATGRFSVEVADTPHPVAEIGAGTTIGEIAFFAGGPRTATCRALRDSIVLRLTRANFADVIREAPHLWSNITAALAQRLAAETRKGAKTRGAAAPRPRPRTIALVPAGPLGDSARTARDLALLARAYPSSAVCCLTSGNMAEMIGDSSRDETETAHALNALEERYETLLYLADPALTPWSERAIRQADEVILVARGEDTPAAGPVICNALERFSYAHAAERSARRHRLVLLHETTSRRLEGTRHWLSDRPISMHHHAARSDAASLARVWRFVTGAARGFVACGGGAYCSAHIGLHRALREADMTFDMYGGTSGGAAMAAAFAYGLEADAISARVEATFIAGKAMRRYTLPRYGLIDHTHFDAHMRSLYGDARVEDLWFPFFAVALDLTTVTVEIIRSGPVWEAVRASAAIPGLLPPFINARGHLLVDGSVAANVPIDIMHRLKAGPNVVVTFAPPQAQESNVPYDSLPGRRRLLLHLLNPFATGSLPALPSAGNVLVRTLMANRNHFERHLQPTDWLLMPPLPDDLGALDWRRHREVTTLAYHYAQRALAERGSAPFGAL